MKVFLWEELGDGLYGNVHFKSFGKVGNVGTVPIGRIGFTSRLPFGKSREVFNELLAGLLKVFSE